MPARTMIGESGSLVLTLSNGGEEIDCQLASSPEVAVKVALMMIVARDELVHGDQLTVRNVEDGLGRPVPGLRRPLPR